MSRIHTIHSNQAPDPAGHYSQAVRCDNLIFVSGQLAIDAHGKVHNDKSVLEQMRIIFKNIEAILDTAGSRLDNIASVTIYIIDIEEWPEVNRIYGEILGNHKPSRAIVPVKELHYGLKLEIQLIAAV